MATVAEAVLQQCRCGGFCVEGWVCEAHPWLGWPHDDCAGPGMPCSRPIRDPKRPLSGETFITHQDVFLRDPFPYRRPEDAFWAYVRSLGIKAEDYEAWEDPLRYGWSLVRKRSAI